MTQHREQPFNLLRSFLLLSFLCISVIGVASALLLSRFLTDNILQRDAVVTMQFVQSILQTLNPDLYFFDFVAVPEISDIDDPIRAEFENVFQQLARMPEVVRANVYAQDKKLVWSTSTQLIGKYFPDNPELETALRGGLAVKTGVAEHPHKAEHVQFKRDVYYFAENYIPIWSHQQDRVLGVVEVYKIPDALFTAIARGNRLVWTSTVLGGIFLYGALFWIVRHAARVIQQQRERLVASETMATVGEMASAIAHSIRNPLASIRSSAELALELDDAHDQRQTATDIMATADRLEALVRMLLTYSRPLQHTPVPLQVNEVLQEVVHDFRRDMEKYKITLQWQLAASLPLLRGDRTLLSQVFRSLLANALEAMPDGGTMTIGSALNSDRRTVRISFRETGHGIQQSQLVHVFKPFFTTKHRGLGVGLALAKRIIESHSGTITLASEAGHGTVVVLSLPVAES